MQKSFHKKHFLLKSWINIIGIQWIIIKLVNLKNLWYPFAEEKRPPGEKRVFNDVDRLLITRL